MDTKEAKTNRRMRIAELASDPGPGTIDADAEFFLQFANERRACRLAGLDLAARKLPVASANLSRRSLREEEFGSRRVAAQQDRRCDFRDPRHRSADATLRPMLVRGRFRAFGAVE